jgi:HlyD family secretion protein
MGAVLKNRMALIAAAIVMVLVVLAVRPRAVEVELARVTRGPLGVTLDEEGRTRVRERFVVTAPVSGRVGRIVCEPGDRVTRDEIVATIHPETPRLLDTRARAELSAQVEAARATLGQAKAQEQRSAAALSHARSQLRRLRPLATAGAVSPSELERYEVEERSAQEAQRAAEFAVDAASHQLEAARAGLLQGSGQSARGRAIDARAPVDGVVLKRFRESESVVPAGEPLLEIGDAHQLEVVADYLSTDAVAIPSGAPALIEHWGGPEPLVGRVRRIEPSGFTKISALGVEEQRVNVIVQLTSPDGAAQALGDGYRVEVRVILWEQDKVLKVPIASLFRQGDQWAAFVVTGQRAALRLVKIGHRTDQEAEVLDGLTEGDRVVIHPGDTLHAGGRITPTDRS